MCFSRRFPAWRVSAALAMLLLAAACQPLPRPFAPDAAERRSNARMLKLADSGGVVVLPLSGTSDKMSALLVSAVIKALHELNIPAADSGSNRRSRALQGWLTSRDTGDGAVEVEIVWDLFDGAGRPSGSRKLRWRVIGDRWQAGDNLILDVIAGESAVAIAAAIQQPAARPASEKSPPADADLPPLQVLLVEGAPGDGPRVLRLAMEEEFRLRRYPVTDKPQRLGLIIAGTVAMGSAKDGQQTVRVVWTVRRNDGTVIGRVTQNNTVPDGSLNGPWGKLAGTVAANAAGGVEKLLERAVTDSK